MVGDRPFDHFGWMAWNFRQSGHIQTVASVASELHFLQVSLRFDYASTGLTLLHEAHILLVGSGAFIAFLSDFYGGRQSEPGKIPWLVRLYRALYYPII